MSWFYVKQTYPVNPADAYCVVFLPTNSQFYDREIPLNDNQRKLITLRFLSPLTCLYEWLKSYFYTELILISRWRSFLLLTVKCISN